MKTEHFSELLWSRGFIWDGNSSLADSGPARQSQSDPNPPGQAEHGYQDEAKPAVDQVVDHFNWQQQRSYQPRFESTLLPRLGDRS